MVIGIQVCPHAILDEGIDSALDLMRDAGTVNALMLNSHTYYGAANGWRESGSLAGDHGIVLREHAPDTVAGAWIHHHDPFFAGQIGHRTPPGMPAGADPYNEIVTAAHERGMAVYARIIEGWEPVRLGYIPGWQTVCTVDVYNEPHCIPCFANPLFLQWWQATVEDIFAYPVDGIFYGFERGETLSDVLFRGQRPYCFCPWCIERARRHNIDAERAREGYRELHRVFLAPADEPVLDSVLRVLFRYPEVIHWGRLEQKGKEDVARLTASIAHRGGHLFGTFGAVSLLDPVKQAWEWDSAVLDACDFYVSRVYADVGGPRLARTLRAEPGHGMYRGVSPRALGELAAAISGVTSLRGMSAAELDRNGMPLGFVPACLETYVREAGDSVDVYAGIGVDIPAPDDPTRKTDPRYLERVTECCLEQGVDGIVLCREYEEIRASSMRVVADVLERGAAGAAKPQPGIRGRAQSCAAAGRYP